MVSMKRVFWTIAGVCLFALAWGLFSASEAYSGLCIRCLQSISGVDKSFLGIRYFHKERMTTGNGGLMSPAIFGPPLPAVDPHTYESIFEKPCEHQFVRTGFCRYGAGGVGCGVYGSGREYDLRLGLVQSLFLAYQRVPDRQLAQETYALIDHLYPYAKKGERPERPMRSAYDADSLPNEPLSILVRGLSLLNSQDEWRTVLDAARTGNGAIDLLNDRTALIGRLKDSDPVIRRQAVASLAARNEPESWGAVASVLDNPSDEVGGEAVRQILWNRCFEQYDRALAWDGIKGADLDRNELAKNLTDQEIHTLLTQKKARVDSLCFLGIEAKDRVQFLEEVLGVLNDRPSPEAKRVIAVLIAGPYPDLGRDQKTHEPVRSHWQWFQEVNKGVLAQKTPARRPSDKLIRRAMELGLSEKPGNWELWKGIFEGWMAESASESWSAAFAEAMYTVDSAKTIEYFKARLITAGDIWGNQASHVLTGMGVIGVPDFLPAIQEFVERSKRGNYEKNAYYRKFVDYALHRCRQIHRWELVSNAHGDGRYSILRTDGTFVD